MSRLALGAGLLIAALLVGFLAGNTGEDRARVYTTHTRTEMPPDRAERVESRAVEPSEEPVPGEQVRIKGTASAQAKPADSPEASGLVERMRRHLPGLADWQADEIRRYHAGYERNLHHHALAVTATLAADAETQRRAVARMRELKRSRNEFLRDLLGRESWEAWREIELTGGRSVDEFLRTLQERNSD